MVNIVPEHDFYFYNTDCIYCSLKYDIKIRKYFSDNRIAFESKKYVLNEINNDRVLMNELGSDKAIKLLLSKDISEYEE